MKVFIHSKNKQIDGKTINNITEVLYLIHCKYKLNEYNRTHFDILDDKTYIELMYIKEDEMPEEIRNEIISMLDEYQRYLRKG